MEHTETQTFAYCLSCYAGYEAALQRELRKQLRDVTVYYPLLDREEKHNGVWTTRSYPLLPGYLFLYADAPIPAADMLRIPHVVRLLGYRDGDDRMTSYPLRGEDLAFARWVLHHQGHITVSRAIQVGQRVQIVSGPLKDYEGSILRVDKHKRSALVDITIGDLSKSVWLSFEWVEER